MLFEDIVLECPYLILWNVRWKWDVLLSPAKCSSSLWRRWPDIRYTVSFPWGRSYGRCRSSLRRIATSSPLPHPLIVGVRNPWSGLNSKWRKATNSDDSDERIGILVYIMIIIVVYIQILSNFMWIENQFERFQLFFFLEHINTMHIFNF